MQLLSPLFSTSLALPPDSYIYTLVPTSGGLAALSSDDSLRVFDPSVPTHVTFTQKHVNSSVTSMKACSEGVLATAGRDGAVRFWDVRQRAGGKSALEFRADFPISALACSDALNYVAAGAELETDGPGEAPIVLWDARSPKETNLRYTESHNDTITELQFHPNGAPILLSGSTDGLINLFDLNAPLSAEGDEEPLQVVNHGSAIHHAGFLPGAAGLRGGSRKSEFVYGLSTDESFAIYPCESADSDDGGEAAHVFGDVRVALGCEYVVGVKEGGGMEGGDAVMVCGNHSEQYIDIIPFRNDPLRNWTFDPEATIRLPGAHAAEIVRDAHIDHSTSTVYTCGEDGFVRAWRSSASGSSGPADADADATMSGTTLAKGGSVHTKRGKRDGGVKGGRYKPY